MTAPPPIIPPRAGQAQPDLKPAKQSVPTPGISQPGSTSEKRPLAPTRADFGEWDWDFIVEAVYPVMAEVHDIQHHRMADSSWEPWAKRGETPELIAECRAILAQLEAPIKAARREIAILEGTARLRAHRRIKNSPNPQSNIPLILRRAADHIRTGRLVDLRAGNAIVVAVTDLVPVEAQRGVAMSAVRAIDTHLGLDTTPGALAVFAWWERHTPRADVIEALEATAANLTAPGEA